MENITDNLISYSPCKVQRPRFSMSEIVNDKKSSHSISFGRSSNGSIFNGVSSDGEWARIEKNLEENQKITAELENEIKQLDDDDNSFVRALTFDSPPKKRSLSEIQSQKEELELIRRSMELDEEMEVLDATLDAIEENFKMMYAEITIKRAMAKLARKTESPKFNVINYFQLIEDLNLYDQPYIQWASLIEKAVFDKMIQ